MPGLCFESSRWIDRLWSEHLIHSQPARNLVAEGIVKQGERFAGFGADLLSLLYLPGIPTQVGSAPDWALELCKQAGQLGEWARLKLMCARNGFASGIAAEVVLEQLLPLVPSRPKVPAESTTDSSTPSESGQGDASPVGTELDGAQVRAAIRRGARAARAVVEEAELGLEGLGLGFSGNCAERQSDRANLRAIRDAHGRLSRSRRLRNIAELAGRLERVAASKARSRVRPGVGEIYGVETGGDLSRLVPSELAGLRSPRLRRVTLAKLTERRALVYAMQGREPLARGPVVVLLDESASMRSDDRDIWSKAVCLALLSTAKKQRRSWHLVAFNGAIRREVCVALGNATMDDIEAAVDHDCAGGTNFSEPVLRATELIRQSAKMKQADVVIVTDGEDGLSCKARDAAIELTKLEGVSWFVVGVGPHAERSLESLGCIATSMVRVDSLKAENETTVDVVNLERGHL